jgi:NAD(P)-dependent dehydrogenase (short-subunit alcohol dehydrogenase family)
MPYDARLLPDIARRAVTMDIKRASVLVTGGASGLGAATVRAMCAAGATAVIADVNRAVGEDLVRQLDGKAEFVQTDVTDEAAMRAAVNAAAAKSGGLRVLVNCAGVAIAEKVLGKEGPHPLDRFERVIRVNLIGTFNAMRLAADAMAKNEPDAEGERGVIVCTASVAAFEGQIGQIAYSASKGGIAAMTLPAARDLARSGIRVMSIAPGIFDTPLLAGLPEPARISLGQQVPFPSRLGRPEEFAMLARHIVENTMLNGEIIRLDGAMRMGPR